MGYKPKRWYEYINTLPFREGVWHDKGVVFAKLEDEIENAYNAGYNDAISEVEELKKNDILKWFLAIIIFILIGIIYTIILFIIFTHKGE